MFKSQEYTINPYKLDEKKRSIEELNKKNAELTKNGAQPQNAIRNPSAAEFDIQDVDF